MDDVSLRMSQEFGAILAKNTFEWANIRLAKARESKSLKEQSDIYDEVVRTLLDEKTELQNIARQYKDLYEQVNIKPEDIQLLKKTVRRVIELIRPEITEEKALADLMKNNYTKEQAEEYVEEYIEQYQEENENLEKFTELIDNDTLQTMQLLGFSYKEAIGKPLTDLCASLIRSQMEPKVR